jgi:magnesium chelatase family protein
LNKISGPLLDRIDLHVEVPAIAYKEMRGAGDGVSSAEMRGRVESARAIQHGRGFYNAHIPHRHLRKLCVLDDAGERTLEIAVRRMGLSARAHDRIPHHRRPGPLRPRLRQASRREAVQDRSLDRNYWA